MYALKRGDFVARKSYGGDVFFTIEEIDESRDEGTKCVLRGLHSRLIADADIEDLIKKDTKEVLTKIQKHTNLIKRNTYVRNFPYRLATYRANSRPGTVLHIDSSQDFMDKCVSYYRQANIRSYGIWSNESEQAYKISSLLQQYRPDILVITGHDAMKKGSYMSDSIENYRNSKYFIQAVKEARKYQPDKNKLCIFAGACQSYYQGIMAAGANFASSPGRILINALDPAIVSEKVALTDFRSVVTPQEISRLTVSGSKGIGGIPTKGHLTWV